VRKGDELSGKADRDDKLSMRGRPIATVACAKMGHRRTLEPDEGTGMSKKELQHQLSEKFVKGVIIT